jgi:hypothetical protein
MNQDAIDRALHNDREITPSGDFPHRVMRSVRQEAAHRQAMPFPWQLLAGGLAVTAGLTLAGVLAGGMPSDAAFPELAGYLAPALAWLCTTLAGSLGLAWWSVRFAGR